MEKKKWYQNNIVIIAFLILFFPVGLFLMWKYANWSKTVKWVVTGILVLIIIVNGMNDDTSPTSKTPNSTTSKKENTKTPAETIPTEEKQIQETSTVPITKAISPESNQNKKNETTAETVSQKNALKKAQSYLAYTAFSHDGLIAQLEFEQFSHDDAVYGADNSGGNWNEQAAKKAKAYMDYSAFSRGSLIDQLIFDKFTQEQAEFGADSVGL